jgi:hypothetical protein
MPGTSQKNKKGPTKKKTPKKKKTPLKKQKKAFRLHKQQLKFLYKSSFCSTKKKFGF